MSDTAAIASRMSVGTRRSSTTAATAAADSTAAATPHPRRDSDEEGASLLFELAGLLTYDTTLTSRVQHIGSRDPGTGLWTRTLCRGSLHRGGRGSWPCLPMNRPSCAR